MSVAEQCQKARTAARALARAKTRDKDLALKAVAERLRARADHVARENEKDLAAGRTAGLSEALLDRLALSAERIEALAQAVEHVATLPDAGS